MAGGLALATPIGAIMSTNITPSKENGIGNYTLEQFDAAVRKGVRADGKHLYPAMPYTSYALLSDDDVAALYAYFMNGVAPVETRPAETKLPFPFNIRLSMAAWNLLFLDERPVQAGPRAGRRMEPRRLSGARAGALRHLPHAAQSVHGGKDIQRNGRRRCRLLACAQHHVRRQQRHRRLERRGTGRLHARRPCRGKSQAAGPMAEAVDNSLRFMTEEDLKAIAVYLKTVPPVRDPADTQPVFAWGSPSDELASIRGVALPQDRDAMSGPQLYDAYCATCHQAQGQGSFEGGLPSLLHNTALGRENTNNLVMVILEGLHRQPDVLMPGFAKELSDTQVATLGQYLIQHFGNPAAKVTAEQVAELRAGPAKSVLVMLAQAALAVGALVVIGLIVLWLRWRRARRLATDGGTA